METEYEDGCVRGTRLARGGGEAHGAHAWRMQGDGRLRSAEGAGEAGSRVTNALPACQSLDASAGVSHTISFMDAGGLRVTAAAERALEARKEAPLGML